MRWDNDLYRERFGAKVQRGLELVAQLTPVRGKLLEIGSETGILSYQLWKLGYVVEGIEFDYKLVDMARRTTAKSVFYEGDVDDVLLYENNYVMAIANDSLHRIPGDLQPAFLENVYNSLKDGGEMVFEMGAAGNDQAIEENLARCFAEEGLEYKAPFFPAKEEYEALLQDAGFTIDQILTYPRTLNIQGEDGLQLYLEMFRRDAFYKKDEAVIGRIISNTVDVLKSQFYDGTKWALPQVRLSGKVIK